MQIRIQNTIRFGEEMEIVDQYYQGEWKEKAGFQYLLYTNEEDEKVVLKFSNDELVMTRFSTPKSIMRFNKNEDGGAIIPTPMGIQQFLITTDLFQLELSRLQVTYRLLTLDGEQEFANYQLLVEWAE
ncbi:DUF1934 domain-containing protein [uncultured Streptococcus sp.]|uniref:DUF1934 domain-containing protein n=1 Tax=uncultured Streptococcus sp. TaxID=83427 RepID=UPI0028DC2B09|nr:DUF1934 domain-containing protein [uncultured Streptococcus sp.]